HVSFKSYLKGYDGPSVIEQMGLQAARNKPLRHFSSGMKQRVKLALACCSAAPIVLLDEPTSNLDQAGTAWYLDLIDATKADRLLIVCSNQEREYGFCEDAIQVT